MQKQKCTHKFVVDKKRNLFTGTVMEDVNAIYKICEKCGETAFVTFKEELRKETIESAVNTLREGGFSCGVIARLLGFKNAGAVRYIINKNK